MAFWGVNSHAYATIVPAKGESVPVALWSISAKDEQALDHYEGWPRMYRKETVIIPWGKRNYSAMVYIMNRGRIGFPSKWYFETVFERHPASRLRCSGSLGLHAPQRIHLDKASL